MKARKILAVILTVAMLLSMATFSVAAESTEVATYADFKAAVEAGNSVILTTDITTDSAFKISGKTLEIDLNDKTLKIGAGDNYVSDASNVTIKNGTINLDGTKANGNAIFCIGVYDEGVVSTLTLNDVNVTGKDYSSAYGVFYLGQSNDAGAMNVINSTVTLDNDLATYDDGSASGGVFKADGALATLSITGSTLDLTDVDRAVVHCATTIEKSTVTIKGTSEDKLEHGFNRSALTITDSDVSISGGAGRGITPAHGPLVIEGNSTVEIYDMAEASIELRDNQPMTVESTASVSVDTAISVGTSTITGTVTVNENLGAAYVAKIGDTGYETFDAAVAAANAMSGEVTVEIYGKVEYSSTTANLTGAYDKINFVGKTDDTEISITRNGSGGYLSATKTVTFTDLLLSKDPAYWADNAGHMNYYFSIQGGVQEFNNCKFPNGACVNTAKATYTECEFYNTNETSKYSLWVYDDADVTVDKCKFTGKRAIKMYEEGETELGNSVTVKNTDFSQTKDGKPAIVLSYGKSVTLEGNTYKSTGVFELDAGVDTNPNGTIVTADITDIACMNDNYDDCGVLVDGKIYTTVTDAAAVAKAGSAVTLMYNATETVEFPAGVTLNKNGYEAANITVEMPVRPTTINNIDDLKVFRDAVNDGYTYKNETVTLACDIDLNNEEWTPIGGQTKYTKADGTTATYNFEGHFDGGNHTIKNLKVTMPEKSNVGFFGHTTTGSVKNLTIENADVEGRLNVGVVAGTPYTSQYANIKLTGHVTVDGMSYVGGVGGKNAYADWSGITIDVDGTSYVKANSIENDTHYRTYVGGVVGFMGEGEHKFTNITSNIDVTGTVCDVGGIVGIAHYNNVFENCVSTGDVKVIGYKDEGDNLEMGGIAGTWHNANDTKVTFINCEFTGTIESVNIDGVTYTGEYANDGLVGKQYSASGTGELVIINFEWMTGTDAGFYMVSETEKAGIMRFLFAADISDEVLESGIKYIKTSDISAAVSATGVQGTEKAFYGDVTDIPEGTEGTYIAVAYVKTANGTFWSEAVECSPSFTKHFTEYTAQ